MCAINPVHKVRFVIDVYTSDKTLSREDFEDKTLGALLACEMQLNEKIPQLRFHVKESKELAD